MSRRQEDIYGTGGYDPSKNYPWRRGVRINESTEHKDMRLLLLDHFINSMPVPVDRDYAEVLLDRVVGKAQLDAVIQVVTSLSVYAAALSEHQKAVVGKNMDRFQDAADGIIRGAES